MVPKDITIMGELHEVLNMSSLVANNTMFSLQMRLLGPLSLNAKYGYP
jgi:hypothetical protein